MTEPNADYCPECGDVLCVEFIDPGVKVLLVCPSCMYTVVL